MIISRKRFQEEIAKAVRQREEEMYLDNRLRNIDNDAHSRMNRIEERLSRLESMSNVREITVDTDKITVKPLNG